MLFSSLVFLYLFLPITLFGYYIVPRAFRNYWLLLASLVFFAWGGVSYTVILIGSIVLNYFFGLAIQRTLQTPSAYRYLVGGVTTNLLLLGVFKYAGFFTEGVNHVFHSTALPPMPVPDILLPIGISFYTFHSLSYLVDIYRGKCLAQRNIFKLSLYISMFSQLIAGPIIRYSDVWQQLSERDHTLARFSSGIERFVIGLGKKVLFANVFARVADELFNMPPSELGAANAWLGLVCYTLQIYCDFSGYSDMAIGLGRLFGFDFAENFNFPYKAGSIQDFWRRWHISLSTFFRDYVYIPLGGNRAGTGRMYFNLVVVFFLTGLWHGARWNFVVWGLFHGAFILFEHLGFGNLLKKTWTPFAKLYTLFVVMFAWVLFRAENLEHAIGYWEALFRFSHGASQKTILLSLVNAELCIQIMLALLGSFGFFHFVYQKINYSKRDALIFQYGYAICSAVAYAVIFIFCTLYLLAGTYNPFIYYHF